VTIVATQRADGTPMADDAPAAPGEEPVIEIVPQ
jgi:hypothetical protein